MSQIIIKWQPIVIAVNLILSERYQIANDDRVNSYTISTINATANIISDSSGGSQMTPNQAVSKGIIDKYKNSGVRLLCIPSNHKTPPKKDKIMAEY